MSISFDNNHVVSKYAVTNDSTVNLLWKMDMRVFVLFFSLLSVVATHCAAVTFDEVKRLQSQLNYLGFDAGSVDGRYGNRTEKALQNLFEKNNIEFQGTISQQSLRLVDEEFVDLGYDINALLMKDEHVSSSELLSVKMPKKPLVILDYDRFEDYRKFQMPYDYSFTGWLWNERGSDGKILTKEVCYRKLLQFEMPTTPKPTERDLTHCQNSFLTFAAVDFLNARPLYAKLFLDMAMSETDAWVYKSSGIRNNNPNYYHLPGILATFFTFYAANKGHLGYSEAEQKLVENYFKRKAFAEFFDKDGDRRTKLCPIKNPMRLNERSYIVNNCGSVRLRFAAGELALAIVSQDEALWQKGLWDLDFTLSMINDEGYFVPLSAKGCKALGYTWDTSRLFSLNVELMRLADFNLLDYRTRHGQKVSDAYEMLFKQYDDITISNHIAKMGIGAASCGRQPYTTHDEFLIQEFGRKDDGSLNDEWVPGMGRFINWSIRFVSEKRPEWIKVSELSEIEVDPFIGNYFTIHPFEFYNANIFTEKSSIWHKDATKAANAGFSKIENYRKQNDVYYLDTDRLSIFPYFDEIELAESNDTEVLLQGDFGFEYDSTNFQEWIDLRLGIDKGRIVNVKLSWITEENSRPPLSFFHSSLSSAQSKCGKIEGVADDSLPFVLMSANLEETEMQNCYINVYKNELNDFDFNRFQQLLFASWSVVGHLTGRHTSLQLP